MEVEASPEIWDALRALSATRLTWRRGFGVGFLKNPTAERVLQTLSINALVFK